MSELKRLKQWMQERGLDYRSLASATGDTYSAIHMMTNGRREINEAFKWRFKQAFGNEAADKVFDQQPINVPSEVTP